MNTFELTPEVLCLQFTIANAYLAGRPGSPWALVDTGTPMSAAKIRQAAAERYGSASRPEAIVLTHGHFDHAGSALALAQVWDVPIYAHRLEMPFLNGKSPYPPKDCTVGGAMSLMMRVIPLKTTDVGRSLRELSDGVVPGMPGWTWYHTPGHTGGHVSLYQPEASILLCGDAAVTMDLDSPFGMLSQAQRISRPPAPVTYDWEAARRSVELLAGLQPSHIGAGHGRPMSGEAVARELSDLAAHFPGPTHGRYATEPARTDENGIVYLPPPVSDPVPAIAAGVTVGLLAFWAFSRRPKAD